MMDAILIAAAAPAWLARLGWALLHFVWQGAVIGLLYAMALPLLKYASSQTRYVVSLCFLVVLGGCLPITFWLLAEGATLAAPVGSIAVTMQTLAATQAPAAAPDLVSIALEWLGRLAPWIVPAWAGGVLLLSARLLGEWRHVQGLVRDAHAVVEEPWTDMIARVADAVGLKRAVRVLESFAVEVPVVVGWLRPVVLVPASVLVGLEPRQLELILVHELAHVRRGDYVVNLLQIALETLLFYHPVVRWISNRVRQERENCCDDLVVRTSQDGLAYARALLELEGLRGLASAAAVSSTGGNLGLRIRRIIGMPAPQRGAADWIAGVALTALGVATLGFDSINQRTAPDEAGAGPLIDLVEVEVGPTRLAVDRTVVRADEPPRSQPAPVAAAAGSAPDLSAEAPARAAPRPAAPVASSSVAERAPAAAATTGTDSAGKEAIVDESLIHEGATALSAVSPDEPAASAGQGPQLETAGSGPVSGPVAEPEPAITGGEPMHTPPPEFPPHEQHFGHEGYVILAYTIGTNGRTRDIEVIDAEGRESFRRAALRALGSWRFQPVLVDGQPVEKRMTQRFSFQLDGSPPVDPEQCVLLTGSRLCR